MDVTSLSRWLDGLHPCVVDDGLLRIEQELTDDTMVVRAEMPGLDPEQDAQITLADDVLRIRAERRSSTKHEQADGSRSEFRYGSFSRTVPVPAGTTAEDVVATYEDGILDVRLPYKPPIEAAPARVPVTRP